MDDPQEGRAVFGIDSGLTDDPQLRGRREPVRTALDPHHPPLVRLVAERVCERLDRMRLGDAVPESVQLRMDLDQREWPAPGQYRQTGGSQPPPPQHGRPCGKRGKRLTTIRCRPSASSGEIDPELLVHTPTLLAQRTTPETEAAHLPVELVDVSLQSDVVPLEQAALLAHDGAGLANRINTALVHGRIAF